jgi:oxygen-dependent protoporphyrinogen oxidase
MSRVVIVGAGLSGLSVAFRLRQARPDVELVLLETERRGGGKVGTEWRDGFRVETGPNGFLDSKPGTRQLCRDLGLDDRLLAASDGSRKNRYVFVRDRLHKLPASPLGIFTTPLLSLRGKLALLGEPFRRRRKHADESVAAFARRRFGTEAADVFVDALVTGIHAGDPERLSVRAAFPRLAQFEAEKGSVLRGFLSASKQRTSPTRMWSFRDGLQALVDALVEHAPITTGVSVKRLEQVGPRWALHGDGRDRWDADAVVLACPAYAQAAALADLDAAIADDLAAIAYNRVAVVALGYRQADVPAFDGFGYVAPQNTRRDVLGVQWCSSIFPDRAPPGFVLWRALCGGTGRPDVFDRDDESLGRTCHAELRHTLGVRGEPVFRRVVRWPRAIPQYQLGHLDRVARIEAAAARWPGLFLAGNALHGIAMNDVTERAELVAGRVGSYLTERG